jgi:hypothetical protein
MREQRGGMFCPHAERLAKAADPVGEMRTEQDHADDVKAGHQRFAEACDHHSVNIVASGIIKPLTVFRMDGLCGQMQQVHNDKTDQVGAAPHHGLRREFRLDRPLHRVILRPSATVLDRKLDRENDVQNDCSEQAEADYPKKLAETLKKRGVAVDMLWWQKDLQVADEVTDNISDHHEPCERDDPLPAY